MDTQTIAQDFTARCKAGDFPGAGATYNSPDIRSVEAMPGEMSDIRGTEAVRQKGEWWASTMEVHSFAVEGPYVNGDQFTVRFTMDVTDRNTGHRRQMDEHGLYTVRDGKIVEERFFYGA